MPANDRIAAPTWSRVVFALSSLYAVHAQDMRENCVSCSDTQRLCELDCMLPTYRVSAVKAWPANQPETFVQMSGCLSGCTKEREECTETTEQLTCLSCVQNCSYVYEAGMLGCLQTISDVSSKATVDDTMDDCSNNASAVMSICAETCYSNDVYGGWTPATEEGIAEPTTMEQTILIPDYRKGVQTAHGDGGIDGEEDYMDGTNKYLKKDQIRPLNVPELGQFDEVLNVDVHLATSDSEDPPVIMDWRSLGLPRVSKVGISGVFAAVVLSVGLYTRARYVSNSEEHVLVSRS
uniref:Uncharacterized protein n=1 Tax=Octactis speculum TaxID=3111310 RepID=A0A7S2FIU7_9STRA|mmetsp:Transcript_22449/g.30708  ORF Transcript_22449/g.30708 Transcript_22449/m.30708 type:complete len:293 (+) Transcript_22449:53-931(+)